MLPFFRRALVGYAFTYRQITLTKRYWMWEVVFMVYSLATTLAIGFLGAGVQSVAGPGVDISRLILYLLTGSLLWGYLAVIFWDISNMITWERWAGTIEYTFMAPVSRSVHILGMCTWTIFYSLMRAIVMLIIVALVFHLDLSKSNFVGALAVLAVANLSFIGLGTLVAILPLVSPEKGAQMTGIVEGILLLVSGVYYDISVLPGWMQLISKLSPATYALRGMRRALLDGDGITALWNEILPLAILGIVLIPLGLIIFRRMEIYCKKVGLLKRSG
ncbi:MAG TPA: ABC transporter permease [Armatimonadota bacterium]|nr:ABC transporter permease [Armatimonadota bacterium]